MSLTNKARHIKWHETCKCICRLDGIICNKKQRWNENGCRCECKELVDKGACDKGIIWNPSKCECYKSCNTGECLDYSNCKCRKKLVDPLVEECTENIDETKINNENKNDNKNKYSFFEVYIVLFSTIFAINIGIGIYLVYCKYVNCNKYDLPY